MDSNICLAIILHFPNSFIFSLSQKTVLYLFISPEIPHTSSLLLTLNSGVIVHFTHNIKEIRKGMLHISRPRVPDAVTRIHLLTVWSPVHTPLSMISALSYVFYPIFSHLLSGQTLLTILSSELSNFSSLLCHSHQKITRNSVISFIIIKPLLTPLLSPDQPLSSPY